GLRSWGAPLPVSLARLDALLPQPAQRIGLSATVRPVDEVARFLAGGRPVTTVQPESTKRWDLRVVVPVPDMTDPGAAAPGPGGPHRADRSGDEPPSAQPSPQPPPEQAQAEELPADELPDLEDLDWTMPSADPVERASVWPHIERRIVELVTDQTSTLVFATSRRLAERLTSRLNEIWEDHEDDAEVPYPDGPAPVPTRPPAQVMAQFGASGGAPPVLARAHHGSVSREQRAEI